MRRDIGKLIELFIAARQSFDELFSLELSFLPLSDVAHDTGEGRQAFDISFGDRELRQKLAAIRPHRGKLQARSDHARFACLHKALETRAMRLAVTLRN